MLKKSVYQYGIREKLILIFIIIKVIPLIILAVFAAQQVGILGLTVEQEYSAVISETQELVKQVADLSKENSIDALDNKSREAIERLTTDTAASVASFLYQRDSDIILLSKLARDPEVYKRFIETRKRKIIYHEKWVLNKDQSAWQSSRLLKNEDNGFVIQPIAPDNKKDFHYRAPDNGGTGVEQPLYLEATFVDLSGVEKIKVTPDNIPITRLKDISQKQNTYCRAEDYFEKLKMLSNEEIYVSEVIGEYVASKIIGPYTPKRAGAMGIPFEPENAGYAGKENPVGKRFKGIIRWARPVVEKGKKVGYVTLALDHTHVMEFTDHIIPTEERFSVISDASTGNYAFMWDHKGKNISHPRDYFIPGYNPETGNPVVPWLSQNLYDQWMESGLDYTAFRSQTPWFDKQSLEKKPARQLIRQGLLALDCRFLNFAPQCTGWNNLTQHGGSGSFVIFWSKLWKLTTAATIPYYTGQYGNSPRGFGFVTIGANVHEFHSAAQETAKDINLLKSQYTESLKKKEVETLENIESLLSSTQQKLTYSTLIMILIVMIIAVWMASNITRKIVEMIKGIRLFQEGNLKHRLTVKSDDEMGQLAFALNEMSDKLNESFLQLEKARAEAEKSDRAKGVFLANMSHEIRTPLNAIIGMSRLALKSIEDEKERYLIKTVRESADSLLSLINDILDFSKVEAGELNLDEHVFELKEFVHSTVLSVKSSAVNKGLNISLEIEEGVPQFAKGDGLRLKQILLNILNNGIKFTEKGSININVDIDEEIDTQFRLKVTVEDTGIGIPKDMLESVFDEFSQVDQTITREKQGAGLGLAISRKLCRLMGGDINIDCVEDSGCTFVFTLMFEKVEDVSVSSKSVGLYTQKPESKTILLVEDNLANRDLARMILEGEGHFVREAVNGLEALGFLAEKPYDMIFMDIQMPKMDGLITTKIIRALEKGREYSGDGCSSIPGNLHARLEGQHHPIIALTAHAMSGDREKCLAAGMDAYLTKPFMPEQILAALDEY